jgi:hypothetical protein
MNHVCQTCKNVLVKWNCYVVSWVFLHLLTLIEKLGKYSFKKVCSGISSGRSHLEQPARRMVTAAHPRATLGGLYPPPPNTRSGRFNRMRCSMQSAMSSGTRLNFPIGSSFKVSIPLVFPHNIPIRSIRTVHPIKSYRQTLTTQ